MATWKTATDLSRRYLVGLERLADYSRRGNLPMQRASDGTFLFDEDIVMLLFRSRRAPALVPGANLGVLGDARLGAADASPLIDAREARRRELWRQRHGAEVRVEPGRRTGTG